MSNTPPSSNPKKPGKLAYALDPANRVKTIMFLGAAGLSLALVGYFVESNTGSSSSDVATSVARAPKNVQFVNGAQTSTRYAKLYDKQQDKAAKAAEVANKSYIPGFLGQPKANATLLSDTTPKTTTPPKVVHLAIPKVVTPPPPPKAVPVSVAAPTEPAGNPGVMKEMDEVAKNWGASSINVVYSALPAVDKGTTTGKNGKTGKTVPVNSKNPASKQATAPVPQIASHVIIGAGRLTYGVLDVSLNSNRPTPVLAEIEEGPLSGTRLLGAFKTEDNRLVIKFSMASLKNGISFPINAVMVNPKVNQAYLASSVNHHYLYRYGMLLGGSFLAGFGQSIQQAGSSTTTGYGGTTQTFAPQSIGKSALSALGQVGATVGQLGVTAFGTPNTVRLNYGQGIGILFLRAVTQSDIQGKNGTGSVGSSSGQGGAKLGRGLTPVNSYGNAYNGYGGNTTGTEGLSTQYTQPQVNQGQTTSGN